MTDVRKALLDVWESIYQIQVIGCAMDPSLLDQFDAHIVNLQYRIAIAKQRANPCAPRGPSEKASLDYKALRRENIRRSSGREGT